MNQAVLETINIAMTNKIQHSVGVSSTGVVVAPEEMFGEFLTTHGVWLLSYSEWMKVLGSIYILFLLIKLLSEVKAVKAIYKFIKRLF